MKKTTLGVQGAAQEARKLATVVGLEFIAHGITGDYNGDYTCVARYDNEFDALNRL
jgi:hypothetical protein